MSIHWSITRAADWVIRLQEENKTDLEKHELITLFTEWVEQSKKDKPKKTPEETKAARVKGASKARETKKSNDETLSEQEKYDKKVLSQKKRAAKAKVGSDYWNKMTEDERDTLIKEDHRKDSQKENTYKDSQPKNEHHDEEPVVEEPVVEETVVEEPVVEEPEEPVVPSKLPAADSDKKKKPSKSVEKDKKKKKSKKEEKSTEKSDGELDFE